MGTRTTQPDWLNGRKVRVIDGSHISEQGSTGSDWILQYSWGLFGSRNDYFEITPFYRSEKKIDSPLKPLRICAARKNLEQAERAKRKTRCQMRAPYKKPLDPITLKADAFSAGRVLELYRLRWQVELAFKCLKSITRLGQLLKTAPESCRTWLYGKTPYGLLRYSMLIKAGLFPVGVFTQNILRPMKAFGGNYLPRRSSPITL